MTVSPPGFLEIFFIGRLVSLSKKSV